MEKHKKISIIFLAVILGIGGGFLLAEWKLNVKNELAKIDVKDVKPVSDFVVQDSKKENPIQKNIEVSEDKKEIVLGADDLGFKEPFNPELDDMEPEEDSQNIIEDPEME